jgi:LysM repeat protein
MEWEYLDPQATATPGDRDPNAHVVQAGETLFGIARQYGLSLEQLRALNRLQGETIYPGQRLVVGKPEPAPVYAVSTTNERGLESRPSTIYTRRPFPDPHAEGASRSYERAVSAYGRGAQPTYRTAAPAPAEG